MPFDPVLADLDHHLDRADAAALAFCADVDHDVEHHAGALDRATRATIGRDIRDAFGSLADALGIGRPAPLPWTASPDARERAARSAALDAAIVAGVVDAIARAAERLSR